MYLGLPLYLPKLVALLVRGRLSENELEQVLTAQYELLYSTSAIDGVFGLETRLMCAFESFLQFLRGRMLWSPLERRSLLRRLSLEHQGVYVRQYLVDHSGSLPDLFVFGHTHRVGIGTVGMPGRFVTLANSSTWRQERTGRWGTYLVLDESTISLRRLREGLVMSRRW